MQIVITYADGKRSVFDTGSLKPFGADAMLIECELSLDDVSEEGLWVSIHHYDANPKETAQGETPAALRHRGWKFLLASQDEVMDIIEVLMDGKLVFGRIGDELVKTTVLDARARLLLHNADALSLIAKIADADDFLARAEGALLPADENVTTADFLGIPAETLSAALEADRAQKNLEI